LALNYYQYAGVLAWIVAAVAAVRYAVLPTPPGFPGIPGMGPLETIYMYVAVIFIVGIGVFYYGMRQQKKVKTGA